MIAKTFKTTTGKITVQIPEKLEEIALGQLMDMHSANKLSDLDAIHILSGTPLATLRGIKNFQELQQFNAHIVMLSEQIKAVYDSDSLPKSITFNINGKQKTVKVISKLGVEPAGAFLAARDVITDEINNHIKQHGEDDWKETFNPGLKACGLILAHYFYCPATGKSYNEYEAEQFFDKVKQLPFTDALPIAKYFFLNYPNLSKPKISCSLRVQLCWKKRLALNRFKNSGMLTP